MAEQSTGAETEKRLLIRKYPNRRYYDSTHSRHVTLEEIYALIRDGYEVQVTDSKTEQDITHKVLAQIIIELDELKLGVFPIPMLHRLLRANRDIVGDFIGKYFNQPLTAFLDSQRNMEQRFRQVMGFQHPTPTMADWAKMMWGPLNPAFWSGEGRANGSHPDPSHPPSAAAGAETASPSAAGEPSNEQLKSQVEMLRQQMAELRAELNPARRRRNKSKRAPR